MKRRPKQKRPVENPVENPFEKLWDPSRKEYVEWDGSEVTVGHGIGPPLKRVSPRLVGPAVENFRRLWGDGPADPPKEDV